MKKFFLGILLSLWTSLASAGVNCSPMPFRFMPFTLADANQVNANFDFITSCLLNAAFAGNNNDITALLALTTPISPAAGGSTIYVGGTSTGSANAQIISSPSPTGFALTRGLSILFTAGFTNTGPTQLTVGATGPTNLFRQSPSGPQAMTGGEIVTGDLVWAIYDGMQFQLVNTGAQYGGFGPLTSLTAAATSDLGSIPSHNITFTGSTAITSFGSSASTTFPVYNLNFGSAGLPLLTHNLTSLILPGGANIQPVSGDNAVAMYLGSGNWQIIDYRRANGTSVVSPTPRCGFSGLVITNNAGVTINWSFNSSVLINPVGNIPIFSTAKSGSISTGAVGAGGLDVAGPGNNNFVYLYAIYNGSAWSAVGSLNSPSSGGPSPIPSGYNWTCYMGAMKTNGVAALYGTRIVGNEASYVVGSTTLATNLPLIDSGVPKGTLCTGATTYATETVRGDTGAGVWMPSTAVMGQFNITSSAGPTALAANLAYTGASGGQAFQSNATALGASVRILMESNAVFWCNTANSSSLFQYGWKDAVNAN